MEYSAKTKEGNWREDAYGEYLVNNRVVPALSYQTETMCKYCNPKSTEAPGDALSASAETTHDLKAKNKDGLSYALLFEHGSNSSVHRFTTNRTLPEGSLTFERQTEIRRQLSSSATYTTQARQASALMAMAVSDTSKQAHLEETIVGIPVCGRRTPLSSTFPTWF